MPTETAAKTIKDKGETDFMRRGGSGKDETLPRLQGSMVRGELLVSSGVNSLGGVWAAAHAAWYPMTHSPSAERTRALSMLLLANFFWGLSFPLIKAILLLHEKLFTGASTWFSTSYTVAP